MFVFFLNFCLDHQYLESIAQTPNSERRDSLPVSFNKRKRKRFSIRAAADLTPLSASGKRRSSVSDAGLSVSGSFLDYTASPSFKQESKGNNSNSILSIYHLFSILVAAVVNHANNRTFVSLSYLHHKCHSGILKKKWQKSNQPLRRTNACDTICLWTSLPPNPIMWAFWKQLSR